MIEFRKKLFSQNIHLIGLEKIDLGNGLSLKKEEYSNFGKLLGKIFKKLKSNQENQLYYTLLKDDKEIGYIILNDQDNFEREINCSWLGVYKDYRGNHYATIMLDYLINYAKKLGFKKFTLEVPGISPDAKHIYEKLGFKDCGILTTPGKDSMWGGLTKMEKKL